MKRPHHISWVLIAAAVLVASVIAFKRYLPYAGPGLLPRTPPAIVLAMENARFVGLGRQGKLWSVRARKVEIGRNRSTTTLTGISDGRIFDRGKVALKVQAGKATYDINSRYLMLTDGILVEGGDGQRLSGEGATWNPETAILSSIGQVSFANRWSRLVTDRLTVNVRSKEMSMWNVRMKLNLTELQKEAGTDAM